MSRVYYVGLDVHKDSIQLAVLDGQCKEPILAKGLYDWGRFFKAKTAEELAMAGERDPAIREATAIVMELKG
jgi:hypothetical protein